MIESNATVGVKAGVFSPEKDEERAVMYAVKGFLLSFPKIFFECSCIC